MIRENIFQCLAHAAEQDDKVGIAIAPLLMLENNGFYVTRLMPGHAITPHYHQKGAEIYLIISGSGLMHTRPVSGTRTTHEVGAGDIFKIDPQVVHQLENNTTTPLVLLFACDPEHLSSDRVIEE